MIDSPFTPLGITDLGLYVEVDIGNVKSYVIITKITDDYVHMLDEGCTEIITYNEGNLEGYTYEKVPFTADQLLELKNTHPEYFI